MQNNKDNSKIERRSSERLKADFSFFCQINKPWLVRLLIKGEEIEAVALNLSEGGMAISTDYDIRVGTVLLMNIMIYKQDILDKFKIYKTIKVQGKVISNVLDDTKKHRIGIIFRGVNQEGKKELFDFAKSKTKGRYQAL
jgi:hypothetical protein